MKHSLFMESLSRKPSDRREATLVGSSHLPKVEGWVMGSRMQAQLVCDALTMAIWQRPPRGLYGVAARRQRNSAPLA